MLTGKRRQEGYLPCHVVADAELEATGVCLPPEIEDEAAIATRDWARVVQEPVVISHTVDEGTDEGTLGAEAARARGRWNEARLRCRGAPLGAGQRRTQNKLQILFNIKYKVAQ